jgi:hypothetical protein
LLSGKYGTFPSSEATNEGIQEKTVKLPVESEVAYVHKNDVQEVLNSHKGNY